MILLDFHIFQSLPSMLRSSQLLSHFLCRSLLLVAKNTPLSFSNCSFLPRRKTVILSLGDSYISFKNKNLNATAQPNFRPGFCMLVPACAFSTLSRAVLLSSHCLSGLWLSLRTESVIQGQNITELESIPESSTLPSQYAFQHNSLAVLVRLSTCGGACEVSDPRQTGKKGTEATDLWTQPYAWPSPDMQGNYTTLAHPSCAPRTPASPPSERDLVAQE